MRTSKCMSGWLAFLRKMAALDLTRAHAASCDLVNGPVGTKKESPTTMLANGYLLLR